MSACCSQPECETMHPRKCRCPINGMEYAKVSPKTIAHHIRDSWNWSPEGRTYYFCDDPECDVVYFADDDTVIPSSQLRAKVGIKDSSDNAMLCYCFGVTRGEARADPRIKEYVIQQTKLGLCSCETSNPSGRCCLKDFPGNDVIE